MTTEQRVEYGVAASCAGEHEVLVKWSFENASVGSAKDGVGPLDVVCDAYARLGFLVCAQAVVEVAAQPEIDGPIAAGDRILQVEASAL